MTDYTRIESDAYYSDSHDDEPAAEQTNVCSKQEKKINRSHTTICIFRYSLIPISAVVFTIAAMFLHNITELYEKHPCENIEYSCESTQTGGACVVSQLADSIPRLPQLKYAFASDSTFCRNLPIGTSMHVKCYLRYSDDQPTSACFMGHDDKVIWTIIAIFTAAVLLAAVIFTCIDLFMGSY